MRQTQHRHWLIDIHSSNIECAIRQFHRSEFAKLGGVEWNFFHSNREITFNIYFLKCS